jgi:hypothetical protein
VRHHINMLGRYSFQLPDLPGGLRPLRDPGHRRGMTRGPWPAPTDGRTLETCVRRCGRCGMELSKGSGRSRRYRDSACRTRA